jgi:hypothetical protein
LGTKNTLRATDRLISCEKCDPFAVTPFRTLLDESAGEAAASDVVLPETFKCPSCFNIVNEDTLIAFRGDMDAIEGSEGAGYFDPPLDEMTIHFVGENLRAAAQSRISGCDQCCDCPEITFDCILDEVTGCDPKSTEYILCRRARCPRCHRDVTERTIILPRQ